METPEVCLKCGEAAVIFDLVLGSSVCEKCGHVAEECHHEEEGPSWAAGVNVGAGDTGAVAAWSALGPAGLPSHLKHALFSTRDTAKVEAKKELKQVVARLQLSTSVMEDAWFLMDRLVEGHWGRGRWVKLTTAACLYIAVRQQNLALTIAEVAAAISCDTAVLGRTFCRALKTLEIQLPDVEASLFLDRAISRLPQLRSEVQGSGGRHSTLAATVKKHAGIILSCAQRHGLHVGRTPLPLAAAALLLATAASGVALQAEDVAAVLYANTTTMGARQKELEDILVKEGQQLPWGSDINHRTLTGHMPAILDHLDLLTRIRGRPKAVPSEAAAGQVTASDGSKGLEGGDTTSKALVVVPEEVAAKGPIVERMPPAFRQSALDRARRAAKVQAAKRRIALATNLDDTGQGPGALAATTESKKSTTLTKEGALRRRKQTGASSKSKRHCAGLDRGGKGVGPDGEALDWEDCLIEELLLHGASEQQVEDGHYRAAAAAAENRRAAAPGGTVVPDAEVAECLRTPQEVEFVKVLEAAESVEG